MASSVGRIMEILREIGQMRVRLEQVNAAASSGEMPMEEASAELRTMCEHLRELGKEHDKLFARETAALDQREAACRDRERR
jgi:hypothetical protein